MHRIQSKTSHKSPLRSNSPYKNPGPRYEGMKLFAVFPDYWPKAWGEPPLLGHVKETSEYWARYAAYDAGLLPYNYTFGPRVMQVDSPIVVLPKRKYYGTGNKVLKK